MDPDLEKLLRAVSRFLPLLIPIAIIALPAILRALSQRRPPQGQGGQAPTPDSPPAANPTPGDPDAEGDLVAQVRRMLEQRQGLPQTPAPAPPPQRPSVSRVPPQRRHISTREDEIEARGVAHRSDPPAPPPRRRERPRRETSPEGSRRPANRPLKQRPATEYVQPTVYQSAAEQKDAQAAAKVPVVVAPPLAAVRVVGSAGQELVEAITRNPLTAILAAEVFGPCRAAGEIGEGPTSPVGLRGS